jgi:hypothetical protein
MVSPRAPDVDPVPLRSYYGGITGSAHYRTVGGDGDSDDDGDGDGGGDGGGDGDGEAAKAIPPGPLALEAALPPPRPPRTLEALGLLLAVLATPPECAGDVPGYVRMGGMGLLWNLAARDAGLERHVSHCEQSDPSVASTVRAASPPLERTCPSHRELT